MFIRKDKYKMLNTMTNDLMKAEEYINTLGVATREPNNDDEFRNMYDILEDILTVMKNNPTINRDVKVFLKKENTTTDDLMCFQIKYDLTGIMSFR